MRGGGGERKGRGLGGRGGVLEGGWGGRGGRDGAGVDLAIEW